MRIRVLLDLAKMLYHNIEFDIEIRHLGYRTGDNTQPKATQLDTGRNTNCPSQEPHWTNDLFLAMYKAKS